jgi:hypothetical protein
MRLVDGVLAVVFMGAFSQAFATDPDQQLPNAAQPAQSSTPAQAPTSPPNLQAGAKPPVVNPNGPTPSASATDASKPPLVVQADKPELTPDEQHLVSRGYKLEMRNGEKWFCRSDLTLGSRLSHTKTCGTASMLSQARANMQQDLRHPAEGQPKGN